MPCRSCLSVNDAVRKTLNENDQTKLITLAIVLCRYKAKKVRKRRKEGGESIPRKFLAMHA